MNKTACRHKTKLRFSLTVSFTFSKTNTSYHRVTEWGSARGTYDCLMSSGRGHCGDSQVEYDVILDRQLNGEDDDHTLSRMDERPLGRGTCDYKDCCSRVQKYVQQISDWSMTSCPYEMSVDFAISRPPLKTKSKKVNGTSSFESGRAICYPNSTSILRDISEAAVQVCKQPDIIVSGFKSLLVPNAAGMLETHPSVLFNKLPNLCLEPKTKSGNLPRTVAVEHLEESAKGLFVNGSGVAPILGAYMALSGFVPSIWPLSKRSRIDPQRNDPPRNPRPFGGYGLNAWGDDHDEVCLLGFQGSSRC